MSEKPFELVKIDDTVRHLRATMRKADHHVPKSMARQLPGMVGHYLRNLLQGQSYVFPGMSKMASWGECSERQARENFARLRDYGIVVPISYTKGGRRATRFSVNLEAICRYLITVKANPSQALLDKVRSHKNPEVNPEENPEVFSAINPAEKPEATSAGILIESGCSENDATVVTFPCHKSVSGGRS